jgi:hypothetical protein
MHCCSQSEMWRVGKSRVSFLSLFFVRNMLDFIQVVSHMIVTFDIFQRNDIAVSSRACCFGISDDGQRNIPMHERG